MRIFVFTAGCAPNAVQPLRGTCKSPTYTGPTRRMKPAFFWPRNRKSHEYEHPDSSGPARERLRDQDSDRQWHRLRQCQHAVDEIDLQKRHPGDGEELLPVEHPG